MLVAVQDVKTLRKIHPDDYNDFIMVSHHKIKVSDDFLQKEFYNPNTGLEEHPISVQLIECYQFLRTYFNRPVIPTSTYRNYVPKDPDAVKHSTHQYAEAGDLKFRASRIDTASDEAINQEILLTIRADVQEQGEIFQGLFERGCRGIGVYDDILHIDTLPTEIYDYYRKRRNKNSFRGRFYGYWDSTKVLRLLEPTGLLYPEYVLQNPPTIQDKVEIEVKKAAGSFVGFWKDISSKREDDYLQADEVNVGYAIAFILIIALFALGLFLMVKRYVL